MTAQGTPMIPVEKIVVEQGLNARKSMDQEALKRLGKSIAKDELVQPITVRPIDGGKYALIAGERRYEAAKLEGIEKLPGHIVTSGNRRTISFIENLHREDLNKIEEAEGLEDLAKELKLISNKALAEEVGMSQAWVSSRRRLLKLPEKVQLVIARDEVPIEAAPLLIKVAAVSPRIAERLCEVYKADEAFSDFVRDFTDMLYAVADEEIEDQPTMIDPDCVSFSAVFDDEQERRDHAARYLAAVPHAAGPKYDPSINLGDAEVTAARAGKVLLEHEDKSGDYFYTTEFLVDKAWAKDLVIQAIERAEKEKKRRDKEQAKRDKEATDSPEADVKPSDPDAKKAAEMARQRQAAKKEAQEQQEAAAAFNDRLGHALMKNRTPESRKRFGLARQKAAAISLIRHDQSLASAGLRLVLPQLQQTQTEADGAGGKSGKVSYATLAQSRDFLIGKIEACKSQAEINEWISMAQIAAILADEDAVGAGEGSCRHDPAEDEVKELLAEEIKLVKPRRSPKQRKEEKTAAV
ncbi:MAG TPA: ParB/RepB/Spo0J family partition protein [Solirubrobacterales bacterium]